MRFLIELDPNEVSIIRAALGEAALALHPEEVFERTGYNTKNYDVLFEKMDSIYKLTEQKFANAFSKSAKTGFGRKIHRVFDWFDRRHQEVISKTNVEFIDKEIDMIRAAVRPGGLGLDAQEISTRTGHSLREFEKFFKRIDALYKESKGPR